MCRILRVWKLKTSINTSHLLGFGMEGSGRQNHLYFTCLEGSGRLKVSYFTGLEAQNREKYKTFAQFWGGSVVQAPPFGVTWRALFFRGAVAFLPKRGHFL